MATKYIPRMRGLYTFKSEISEVPEGSFDICDNFVIDKEGVLEPRRGYSTTELSTGVTDDIVEKFFEYQGKQLLKYPSGLYKLNDTTLTEYTGNFSVAPDAVRNREVLANRNFYIATGNGVLKLDDIDGIFRKSGAPAPVPPTLSLTSGDILKPTESYRYRAAWGYTDGNDNLIIGPVSDAVEISNTGTENHNIQLTIDIPDEVTDNQWFLQLYRSFAATVPDEELQLTFEKAPTAAELMARKMVITNDTPDASLGALVYTAPSQGAGIIANNSRPPRCADMTLFNNHVVYANTTGVQKQTFTIIATGVNDVSGVSGNQTKITIDVDDTPQIYTGGLATAEVITFNTLSADNTAYEDLVLTIPFTNGSETNLEFSADGGTIGDGNINVNIQEAGVKAEDRLVFQTAGVAADYDNKIITVTNRQTGEDNIFELYVTTQTVSGSIGVDIGEIDFTESTSSTEVAVAVRNVINSEDGLVAAQVSTRVVITQDTAGLNTATTTDIVVGAMTNDVEETGTNDQEAIRNILYTVLQDVVRLSVTQVDTDKVMITQIDAGSVIDPTSSDDAVISVTSDTQGEDVEDVANKIFEVIVGTGSASTDNELTARSLVRVINGANAQVANGVTSIYSTSAKLTGTIILEQKTIVDTPFTIAASALINVNVGDTSFDPSIKTPLDSTSTKRPNGLLLSKPDQPEAVPEIQFILVGSANSPIRRVLPIRDSLFIFKDDGIFQMTGSSFSTFRVEELDLTARVIAPETVVALNNQVWALTDQGIVSVTESAVQIRSREIEDGINRLFITPDTLFNNAFSIPYESDRKLIYFCPEVASANIAQQAFVFNTITNTWTRWTLSAKSGTVFNDKVNLSSPTGDNILIENKNFSFRDYADGGELVSITNVQDVNGKTEFIVPDVTLFEVNGLITVDGELGFYYIGEIDVSLRKVTLETTISTSTTQLRPYRPIPVRARWNPIDVGDISFLKQFSQMLFSFRRPFVKTLELSVVTDNSRNVETQPIHGEAGFGLWGAFPWGMLPWGGGEKSYKNYRALIPRNKAYGIMVQPQISQAVGFSNFELVALTIDYRIVSERSAR